MCVVRAAMEENFFQQILPISKLKYTSVNGVQIT